MSQKNTSTDKGVLQGGATESKPIGLVMPISSIEDLDGGHWLEVKGILSAAVRPLDRTVRLVSDDLDSGLIHARIVQNLLGSDLVICDVSCRNPNVMFELGLRVAFDKPTIIIKDDVTPFTFDTSSIEHLEYPRDLRHSKVQAFQEKLLGKVQAALDGNNGNSFIQNFGSIKIPEIRKEEVPEFDFLMDKISGLERSVLSLTNAVKSSLAGHSGSGRSVSEDLVLGAWRRPEMERNEDQVILRLPLRSNAHLERVLSLVRGLRGVNDVDIHYDGDRKQPVLTVKIDENMSEHEINDMRDNIARRVVSLS